MFFVVITTYDRTAVGEFDSQKAAEEFCAKFLADESDNGGQVLRVIEGRALKLEAVEKITVIKLV